MATELGTSPLAAEIRLAAAPLRTLIAGLDPRDVPLPWAPDVLAAFVEVQRLAESGRLLMTARATEAGQWERDRFATAADWLASQQGTSTGRAKADLEASERLADLDATADAVRAGLLSPEQASAVADAAAVNPDAEADLLDRARRDSLRRTKQEAERRKAEVRTEAEKAERERRVHRQREVRFWYGNGAGNMSVTGPIAAIKAFEQRIQTDVDRKYRENRNPAQRQSRGNYAFDALMDLANTHTPSTKTASTKTTSKQGRGSLRRLLMMRVDLPALMRGWTGHGETCEIGDVTVSVDALRAVVGDSILQLILTNGEAVIDVVNLSRKPTVAQQIAKLFHDSTCTVEGCDRAARLDFDHRDPWAEVLVTELDNLDLLCDFHHDLKTYEGWTMAPGIGRRAMHPPGSAPPKPAAAPKPTPAEPKRTPIPADLAARIERIRRKEAEHQARLRGQDQLFETG